MSIASESSHRSAPAYRGASIAAVWHKSAPAAVRESHRANDEAACWKAWRRHLRSRRRAKDRAAGMSAVVWGLSPTAAELRCLSQWADVRASADALHDWLRDATVGRSTLEYALSALLWCRRLPDLAAVLPAGTWWKLLDHLLRVADEAAEFAEDDPLIRQLLAGELPWTLASLLPEIRVCRKLRSRASKVLSAGLADLLDGEGLPHADLLDRLPLLLACWTRCRLLADARRKRSCWNAAAETQYHQLVQNVLRLSRRDGSLVFSQAPSDDGNADLLAAALDIGGDKDNLAIAVSVLAARVAKKPRRDGAGLPTATIHSEWAAVASLRPCWSRSSPRLAVLYPHAECRVELACGRDVLCSGTWSLDVVVDGVSVSPVSDWTEVCWVSDDDVDYLELEISLGEGVRVQRHMLLARQDRILLMADSVLASRHAALDYRGTLPLWPGAVFQRAGQNSEGLLVGRKPRATVVPPALCEWASERRSGELTAGDDGLVLRQLAAGRALFAPLFFDFNPSRMGKPVTWRQLTVAQSWAVEPPDVAVGYRVAVGRRQWLLFRSLAAAKNRTLLGHNLSSGMLAARFLPDGEVETILEVE